MNAFGFFSTAYTKASRDDRSMAFKHRETRGPLPAPTMQNTLESRVVNGTTSEAMNPYMRSILGHSTKARYIACKGRVRHGQLTNKTMSTSS